MFPAMKEVAGSLPLSVCLRHPAAARTAEAVLQRQADADVAIPLAQLADNVLGRAAVRIEQDPFAVSAGVERIVDVEADRCAGARTIFNECSAIRPAIEIGIELVGAIKGEA